MTNNIDPTTPNAGPPRRRANSCLGSFFLFVVFIFLMGAVLDDDGRSLASDTAVQTAPATRIEDDALAKVVPTLVPTAVLPATATAAPTSLPPTNTPPPTATATNVPPTATATPPTATAVPPTAAPIAAILPPDAPAGLPVPYGVYSWTLKVPILMYHYISVPPADADVYRTDLSVTPDNFRTQMQYLADNGYTTIDLYDLSLAILDRKELPERPIILSFDDGYVDNYTNAFPILQEFGFTGTFFVVTEFIDFGNAGYLTWDMVKEMAAAGNRFEPHSRTHPDMRGLSREKLIWQTLGPQETLAYHLGYTPRFFSYPSGRYDEDTIQILRELNFWGAVTTMGGHWHGYEDRFEWPRVRIRYATTMADFIDVVEPDNTVGGRLMAP